MESVFEVSGTVLTVRLPEELDHPVSDNIRRESDRIIGHKYIKNMVFDFSKTVFMDSSGIGLLMGRCIQIIHANSHITKLLRISGISRYIEIVEKEDPTIEQGGNL